LEIKLAQITAISRCAGNNHVHLTVELPGGGTVQRTFELADLIAAAPVGSDEYQRERVKLLVREAQAAGNSTYAQIRTYLLNREFVA
jgi:hypothetical protein